MILFSQTHHYHAPDLAFDGSGMKAYPETPDRISRIITAVREKDLLLKEVDLCSPDVLHLIHSPGYIDFLQSLPDRIPPVVPTAFAIPSPRNKPTAFLGQLGQYFSDSSTPLTATSYTAALGAVSVAVAVVEALLAGTSPVVGLSRPPGHHASASHGGGYCLLNNCAIAAAVAEQKGYRVSILDLDYHHGNGTQEIFYDSSQVQFISLHADPSISYPYYWGSREERGIGAGLGFTKNYPLSPRCDGPAYLSTLQTALSDIDAFDPDILLVSLGFDTYRYDPVAGMYLETSDYRTIGTLLSSYDNVGILLEGGYNLDAIGECFVNVAGGLGLW